MKYNFDELINRKNTYSTQWDYIEDRFGVSDILPFSISDTDFRAPLEVIKTCSEILEHGVFGYSRWNHDDFKNSICNYYHRRHQTIVHKETIIYSPSVMYTISHCIQFLTNVEEGVCVFEPMYDAFYNVIKENNRKLNAVQLKASIGNFTYDEKELEKQIKASKLFLLCSPHNPTGKVWSGDELEQIVRLCKKHNVPVISDEIHCDVLRNAKHIPILNYNSLHDNLVIVTSASKTFNIPALGGSFAIINKSELRNQLMHLMKNIDFVSSPAIMGMRATMSAYNMCDDYVDELNKYIDQNLKIIETFVKQHEGLSLIMPQATYLAWISTKNLGVSDEELQRALIDVGKVGIMNGKVYGDETYLRMNCGCSKAKLMDGLERFEKALNALKK